MAKWQEMQEICAGLSPESAATRLLKAVGASEPPVSVVSIAHAIGVGVYRREMTSSSGVLRIDNGQPYIFTNASESLARRRFTIAHELGHLMLHPHLDTVHRDTTFGPPYDRIERQANQFAASLLMPEPWIRYFTPRLDNDPKLMAALFDVSVASMNLRIREVYGLDG